MSKHVSFFSMGGTWNALLENGKIVGKKFLGDNDFLKLEETFGYFKKRVNYKNLEWDFAQHFYTQIKKQLEKKEDLKKALSFVPQITHFIRGNAMLLFDFPSDYMRTSLIAPTVKILLEYAHAHQSEPILGGMGTDTADISLLPLLDTYTFDTNLQPFIFTGSNRASFQKNSDAPENFFYLAKAATLELSAGAYWVFAGHLFKASDLVKLSPYEARMSDNLYTFYSPHLKAQKIDYLLREKNVLRKKYKITDTHISKTTTMKSLFQAISNVHIVDIGDQNELEEDIKKILDMNYKAVIIAGNSQGTVSNPVQYACIEAALQGKLVIVSSRCLSGDVLDFYAYSPLKENNATLKLKNKRIISAHKLNKNVSKALATRAIEEKLNQMQTQELFDRYARAKHLAEEDILSL